MSGATESTAAPPAGADGGAPPPRQGLSDKAAQGFAFIAVMGLVVRAVRFGGMFLLTWLVMPADFALFGYVLTVSQFVSVLRNAGVRDIIIRRQHRAQKWVNPGVWLTGIVGFCLAMVMVVTSPLIAEFYGQWQMVDLVIVMAGTTIFQSLSQAPVGLLQGAMRFRLTSTIESLYTCALMVLTVVFAWMGLGAMSFVLPLLICSVARTAVLWAYARPRVRLDPQFRRWRYLIGDSVRLMSADVARTVTLQGDIIILGRMFPGLAAVGHYVYGSNISRQSMWILSRNLDVVLFPTLSKIQRDRGRQNAAFVRALRMLAVIGVPLCFLQAALSDPLIHTLVPERFYGVIPFTVVLSIAMAGRLMIAPAESMLRGQGRFGMFSLLNWIFAVLYTVGAFVGAFWSGDPFGVAVAIALITGFGGIVYVLIALSRSETALRSTIQIFAVPVLAAGLSCGVAWWASTLIPRDGVLNGVVAAAVVVGITAVLYLPAVWVLERDVCDEFFQRVRGIMGPRLFDRLPGIAR